MTTPTYERPVPAVMIVSLENGETFEPTPEDYANFGYVDRNTVLADWRAFVEDATGTDLLSADSVLNPLWLALHQALNNPASLTDGSMGITRADIRELDRSLREYRVQQQAF